MSDPNGPEGCSEFIRRLLILAVASFWLSYIAAAVDQIRHEVQMIRTHMEVKR